MIHQPLGGAQGSATEIEISAREILLVKANINRIMAAYTGQRLDVIERDTDRDRWGTGEDLGCSWTGLSFDVVGGGGVGV